ncbi:hypothetical protein [Kineococcus sp. SYSU DK005]|uniref:hypothetical protein n=1 Tax=Kineococcus sp. SYSU DK005 TaxID=3383126 RepID=UPI003D7CA436
MGWVEPSDFSAPDAERYLHRRTGRHPALLGELATWVHSTGGPSERLDGTWASLVPLWAWFVRFLDAGCPGIPDTVREYQWIAPHKEHDPSDHQVIYAAEAVEAYASAVVQRLDAGASWQVLKRRGGRRDGDHHRPALVLSSGDPIGMGLPGGAQRVIDPGNWAGRGRQDERLVDFLRPQLPAQLLEQDVSPYPSFLPAPGRLTPAHPYPPFTPGDPGQAETGEGEVELARPAGAQDAPPIGVELLGADEMVLGIAPPTTPSPADSPGQARPEGAWWPSQQEAEAEEEAGDLARWAPLSTRGLHAALTGWGFTCLSQQEGSPRLDRGEHQYAWYGRESAVLIETFTARGKLRALSVRFLTDEAHAVDTPSGRWLVDRLRQLAAERGAALLPA